MSNSFSIYYNSKKEKAVKINDALTREIEKSGGSFVCEKILPSTDIIIAVGGDGTLLRTGRLAAEKNIPAAYINTGTVGFLGPEITDLKSFIRKLSAGNFYTEKRMLLYSEAEGKKFTSLNDMVIKNGSTARIIELDIKAGDYFLGRLRGDGVIISTPTGSTAYSLAAGGPVISPGLEVIVLTPLNPHSLNSRGLVLPPETELSVSCPSAPGREVILTADGQESARLTLPQSIKVRRHDKQLSLVSTKNIFLKNLSEKMNWAAGSKR